MFTSLRRYPPCIWNFSVIDTPQYNGHTSGCDVLCPGSKIGRSVGFSIAFVYFNTFFLWTNLCPHILWYLNLWTLRVDFRFALPLPGDPKTIFAFIRTENPLIFLVNMCPGPHRSVSPLCCLPPAAGPGSQSWPWRGSTWRAACVPAYWEPLGAQDQDSIWILFQTHICHSPPANIWTTCLDNSSTPPMFKWQFIILIPLSIAVLWTAGL